LAPPHGDRNSLKIFRQITVLMLRQCADLDARIAALEAELAELRHRRREHRDATWVRAIAVAIGAVAPSSPSLKNARNN